MASNPYNQPGAVSSAGFKTYSKSAVKAGKVNPYDDFGATYRTQATSDQKQIQASSKPAATPKPKPQQQPQPQQPQPPSKASSIFQKVKSVAKDVGEAAVGSEHVAATGVARVLPGGSADIDAQRASATADQQNLRRAKTLLKTNKIDQPTYRKLVVQNANNANETSKNLDEIEKKMPTKGQLAAGFAGTAADIVSGGAFSGATKTGKVAKAAEVADAAVRAGQATTKAGKLIRVAKGAAPLVASSAAAGGLNTAATGGTKEDVIKNAAVGAAAPVVLGGAAELTGSAVRSIMNKVKPSAEFVRNTKAQSLLKAAQDKKVMAAKADGDKIDNQIELLHAKKADGKFTNVDAVKVKQLQAQKASLGLPETPAPEPGKLATAEPAVPAEGSIAKTTATAAKPTATADAALREDAKKSKDAFDFSGKYPLFFHAANSPKDVASIYKNGFGKSGANRDIDKVFLTNTPTEALSHTNSPDEHLIPVTVRPGATKVPDDTFPVYKPSDLIPLPQHINDESQLENYLQDMHEEVHSDAGPAAAAPVSAKDEPAKFAEDYLKNNRAQAEKDYFARTRQEFGNQENNIVSGDEAKFIIPGFGPDKSVPYHEAASAFAKDHYRHLLADPATKDKPVMIMAGGSGAGKTSSLREVMADEGGNLDDFAAVVDTNLTDMSGAESRIQAALKSGRQVEINFVYRHPDESYMDGVVPRAAKTGRIVTPEIHDNTHVGSIKTIQELAEKYKNNDQVDIHVIDNSRGRGNQTLVSLDFLKDKGYNSGEVESRVNKLLDAAQTNKQLTEEQVHELRGKQTAAPEESGVSGARSDQATEQVGSDVSAKSAQEHKEPVKAAEPGTRTLTPAETAHMSPIGGYTHSKDLVNDYADMLRGMEQQAKGGTMIDKTASREAYGEGKRRISEHSKFYREYFAENKKPPTIAAYREEATKQLEAGTDQFGAGNDYKKLLEREAKPVPRLQVESSVKDVPQGTSKVAQRIARDLKQQYDGLAQFDRINVKDQAVKAEKLLTDREKLDMVIAGDAPLPDGLRATSIITAVRNDPELSKDIDLLRRLASSPLASESSLSAQELRLAAENAKLDPVMAMKNIRETRLKALTKRTKTPVTTQINKEVRQIVADKPIVKKETWESFIDSLKC